MTTFCVSPIESLRDMLPNEIHDDSTQHQYQKCVFHIPPRSSDLNHVLWIPPTLVSKKKYFEGPPFHSNHENNNTRSEIEFLLRKCCLSMKL